LVGLAESVDISGRIGIFLMLTSLDPVWKLRQQEIKISDGERTVNFIMLMAERFSKNPATSLLVS
jgi:hypothetical protein